MALLVSQDGGVPGGSTRGEGPTSETQRFQERAQTLIAALRRAPTPRYLVADAPRSHEDQAAHRPARGLLPRLPKTLTRVSQVSTPARRGDAWHPVQATTRSQRGDCGHYGMVQRWRVVSAEAAVQRAEATVSTAPVRPEDAQRGPPKPSQACGVLGTPREASPRSAVEVIQASKAQAQVEGGCRFLPEPRFLVSAWWVKNPSRRQGLLMGMP